jgi:hypothetical protein
MINLDELTDKDLQNIGEMVLAELNINLFSAEPTIHKAYHIYIELVQAGYKEKNKQLACEKIKKFFTTRTVHNQRKEFQTFFGIPFSDKIRPNLALSFKTSEINPEVIRKVVLKTSKILCGLEEFKRFKINEAILTQAINELYRPNYHENEWRITIPALLGKIKKILVVQGEGHCLDSLEEFFYHIDPNPKKKKRFGFKLFNGGRSQDLTKTIPQENLTQKKLDYKQVSLVGCIGPASSFDETLLTKANVIKESELTYVKTILELINSDEVQETLNVDLYQNDERHPLITNFITSVKSYNRIMSDRDMKLKEALSELRVTVRALREIGEEITKTYQVIVGGRVQELEFEIRRAH